MLLTFNLLLRESGIDPSEVRLLRHETKRYRGQTPYSVWRQDRAAFDRYQSTQGRDHRAWFRGRFWASFAVDPAGCTVFVGLYAVNGVDAVPAGWTHALNDGELDPTTTDLYDISLVDALAPYSGRLVIDWGLATRSWRQLASNQDKPIAALRERIPDPPFPGYAAFLDQLSNLPSWPDAWKTALAHAHGVYLLTCPRTREQYVGSATGQGGFVGRWREYLDDGSGGNVGLKSREPSDYRVSILQVAGSADDMPAMLAMESLWKDKLQSREMGLNRN